MRRRRRKRSIKWGPVLVMLLLANVAAGLWFSPVTSAHSVRVEGMDASDKKAVDDALKVLQDVPYLRAKPREVESKLQGLGGRRYR